MRTFKKITTTGGRLCVGDVESDGVVAKQVIVEGVGVRYHVAGASVLDASPIVLVHGAGGSTQAHMSYLLPMLARRHRVVSVDLSAPAGVGPSGLTVERLANQVAGVIEQEVPGLAVGLLGYALGAVVCGALAGTRTDLVDRLVLVNGWLRTDPQQALRNRIWRTLRAENSGALKEFMAFCAYSGEYLNLIPGEVDRAVAAMHVDPFVDLQMDLAGRIDVSDLMTSITAPTLVIGSAKDQITSLRHARSLFGAIDNARYIEVTAGHAALHERPAEVLRAAESFLDNPGRYPAGAVLQPLRP
jgi:pimeloyl-ACP methyl ester carboxylesterase